VTGPIRSAKVVPTIEVIVTIGAGVEGDPVRLLHVYYDQEGNVLAWRDRWLEGQP